MSKRKGLLLRRGVSRPQSFHRKDSPHCYNFIIYDVREGFMITNLFLNEFFVLFVR